MSFGYQQGITVLVPFEHYNLQLMRLDLVSDEM